MIPVKLIEANNFRLQDIGGHGTLQKYRGTGTRYFAKISTAVPLPVLSN